MHPAIHIQRAPEHPAVIIAGSGEIVTNRQLEDASNRSAQLFRARGLVAGDRIAILMENHPRFFELCWAAQRSGLIYTAISTRLTVAVIGVPNEEFGEEVKAVVQPRDMADGGLALEQEPIAFCRAHLSPLKCPRSVDFTDELPRHPTGKLYKRLLRDRYWAGHASRLV